MADLEKRMREAAGNLEFEEAARLRDELKRLQSAELALGADPMARQADVEREAGAYKGDRKYGRSANLPAGSGRAAGRAAERPRKPTDADMGPHNFGGGEAAPRAALARKPSLDEMGPRVEGMPDGALVKREKPDPGVKSWKQRGRR